MTKNIKVEIHLKNDVLAINLGNECMSATGEYAHKLYHSVNKVARTQKISILSAFRILQEQLEIKGSCSILTIYE